MTARAQDPGELPDVDYIIEEFNKEKAAGTVPGWIETLTEYCQYKATKPGPHRWKIHEECRRYIRHVQHNGGQV